MISLSDIVVTSWAMPGQLSSKGTHYQLEGDRDSDDCYLLVHGLGIYSYVFDKFAAFLQQKGRCTLRYDNLGMGFSKYPDDVQDPPIYWSGSGHVQQLYDLLDELNLLKKKLIIIGFSMGGAIACLFTEKYPNLVKNLVLLAPSGNSPVPVQLQLVRCLRSVTGSCFDGLILQQLQNDKVNVATKRNSMDFVDPDSPEAIYNYEMVVMQHQNNEHAIMAVFNCLRYFPFSALESSCTNVARNSACRVLILWGINDKTVPFQASLDAWTRIGAANGRACHYQHLEKDMQLPNLFTDRNAINICSFPRANHMFLVEEGTDSRVFETTEEWLRE